MVTNSPLPVPDPDGKIAVAVAAARAMAVAHTQSSSCRLFDDAEAVESMLIGLAMNKVEHGEFYCPCHVYQGIPEIDRPMICPCAPHEEDIRKHGQCECMFFVGDIQQ